MNSPRENLKAVAGEIYSRDIMVEVGSFLGRSAMVWAEYFNKVICIDPWEGNCGEESKRYERTLETFLENTARFNNVFPLIAKSEEAVDFFQDEFFDFCYLDALHDYDHVKQDITLWLPKVKRGGVIGGHDYNSRDFPGLIQAVKEIFGKPDICGDKTFGTTEWLVWKK